MASPRHYGITIVLAALIAGTTHAQQPSQRAVSGLVRAAQDHLQHHRTDEAIGLLWRAEASLEELRELDDSEGLDVLRSHVADMLREADPLREERVEIEHKAAKKLLLLGKKYKSKKWYRLAYALLLEADALKPGLAKRDLAAVAKKVRDVDLPLPVDASASDAGASDLLQAFELLERTGDWRRDDGGMHSPRLRNTSALVLAKSPTHADDELSVQMRFDQGMGKGALVFGVQDAGNFCLAELFLIEDGRTAITLLKVTDRVSVERLAEGFVDLSEAERKAWIEVRITVGDGELTARVNGKGKTTAPVSQPIAGGFGLMISENSPVVESVHFREMKIEPRTDETSPAELTPEQTLAARIAEAESQLGAREAEAAVLELHHVLHLAAALDGDSQQRVFDAAIALLASHDIYHDLSRKARREIAELYTDLANLYLEREQPVTACAVLERASRHDPNVPAELLSEVRPTLQPTEIAEAAPEPAPATETDATRSAFEEGRQYWAIGWDWKPGMLISPSNGDRALHFTAEPSPTHGHVSLEVDPGESGGAGLVFARSKNDFYLFSAQHVPVGIELKIARWRANAWETLETQTVPEDNAVVNGWVPMSIELAGDQLKFRAGTAAPIAIERSRFQLYATHHYGAYAWEPNGARFANLVIE